MIIKPPTTSFVQANIDVKTGDWVKILNEGEYKKLPHQPDREVLIFQIRIPSGEKKLLSMNITTQKEFIQAYGNDSIKWISKKGKVEIVRQRMFDKLKDVIYIHPETEYSLEKTEIEEFEIPIVEEE